MDAQPVKWAFDELQSDSETAIENFREIRMQEPLEEYLAQFDQFQDAVETLIESTVDLTDLHEQAVELLGRPDQLTALRYLASPAISEDDLKTLADAALSKSRIETDPEMVERIVDTVLLGLDRHRFPWVSEGREPTETEREVAVISTAALIATQRVQTLRRNTAKNEQEERVADVLLSLGLTQAPTRQVTNHSLLPEPGEFCRESYLGSRKADLIVRLWDGRSMPIECKVSNSAINSYKRLNNDAAVKGKTWVQEFGTQNCVPAAVLAGVFKPHNLWSAQADGLTLYWEHNLSALQYFVRSTKR